MTAHWPTSGRLPAEAVSKLEITRFSGVALPLPKCREADTEHSGGSTFAPDVDVTRFDTTSAMKQPSFDASLRRSDGRSTPQTVIRSPCDCVASSAIADVGGLLTVLYRAT